MCGSRSSTWFAHGHHANADAFTAIAGIACEQCGSQSAREIQICQFANGRSRELSAAPSCEMEADPALEALLVRELQSLLTQPRTQALLVDSVRDTFGDPAKMRKMMEGVNLTELVQSTLVGDSQVLERLRGALDFGVLTQALRNLVADAPVGVPEPAHRLRRDLEAANGAADHPPHPVPVPSDGVGTLLNFWVFTGVLLALYASLVFEVLLSTGGWLLYLTFAGTPCWAWVWLQLPAHSLRCAAIIGASPSCI